jgi:hypothetical protein
MNQPRLVKWIAADGGWKTGVTLVSPNGQDVCDINQANGDVLIAVKESCCGPVSWPKRNDIQPWMSRDEWEGK